MRGLIRYISEVEQPVLCPFDGVDFFNDLANSWNGLAPAGSRIDLYLTGYLRKDDISEEIRHQNKSISGLVQTQSWAVRNDDELITIQWIQRRRDPSQANDMTVFDAFNKHLSAGGSFDFYEDYDFAPNEFYTCRAPDKTYRKKRVGNQERFDYTFEIRRMASNQVRQLPIITPASAL